MIQLDKAQMEQALVNLLNHAAEAALQGDTPRVRLSGAVQAGAITILVQDNGTGIASALRERIFQPFVSFKHGGNGVGLSLARQILLGWGEADA